MCSLEGSDIYGYRFCKPLKCITHFNLCEEIIDQNKNLLNQFNGEITCEDKECNNINENLKKAIDNLNQTIEEILNSLYFSKYFKLNYANIGNFLKEKQTNRLIIVRNEILFLHQNFDVNADIRISINKNGLIFWHTGRNRLTQPYCVANFLRSQKNSIYYRKNIKSFVQFCKILLKAEEDMEMFINSIIIIKKYIKNKEIIQVDRF